MPIGTEQGSNGRAKKQQIIENTELLERVRTRGYTQAASFSYISVGGFRLFMYRVGSVSVSESLFPFCKNGRSSSRLPFAAPHLEA